MDEARILSQELKTSGSLKTQINLPNLLKQYVADEDWKKLDQELYNLTKPDGFLFDFLQKYHSFQSIEFTIAIRDSENPFEEDGIWHDDGSRVLAASLSLTLNHEIEGGVLEIKNKNSGALKKYSCPSFGEIIIFLTGEYGYLHKINKVIKGRRIIVALWCT